MSLKPNEYNKPDLLFLMSEAAKIAAEYAAIAAELADERADAESRHYELLCEIEKHYNYQRANVCSTLHRSRYGIKQRDFTPQDSFLYEMGQESVANDEAVRIAEALPSWQNLAKALGIMRDLRQNALSSHIINYATRDFYLRRTKK